MSTTVEILQRIIDTKGAGCEAGLCEDLYEAKDYDEELIESLFVTWEHFSGNVTFPVPDPKNPGDRAEARYIYLDLQDGEGFIGEYGELRLDLARNLLKELSK